MAADTLGTGYVIQWFAFVINGLALVVTAQVTRAFSQGAAGRLGGLRGVKRAFRIVIYPNENL